MRFLVSRNGKVIGEIETARKSPYQLEPVDNMLIMKGDILESPDGAKLEVTAYNPEGMLRAGISFKLLSNG